MNIRNQLIAGVVVIIVAVAGLVGWKYYNAPWWGGGGGSGEKADLMTPSPLGDHVLGKADAPVTIVEYASTTCPHCAHFHETTFPELKKRYIDTGKVRFIFREFPLNDIDFFAYMLTRCNGNDKFFDFLDTLYKHQKDWVVEPPASPMPALLKIAKQVGFTDESFEACRKDKKIYDGVAWSSSQGVKLGVNSTPTFFINGKMYTGSMTIEQIEKLIDPLLKTS